MKRFFRYAKIKLRQWRNDVERIPGFGKIVAKSKTITLPGLMKVPLYDVMRFFGQSLSKGVVFQRAAAITYLVFVAVIPMIIALFSAIAFFGEDFRLTLICLLMLNLMRMRRLWMFPMRKSPLWKRLPKTSLR